MRFNFVIAVLLCACGLKAQTARPYFQQQVNYTIDVTLKDNTLTGHIIMEYINNSPDTLRSIYIHFWPNAYYNNNTPFAKQLLQQGNTDFYYSKPEERGSIYNLNFKVDNQLAKYVMDSNKISSADYDNTRDIGILILPHPLAPNSKAIITTPFSVRIPKLFSRMGYDHEHFEFAFWYPKPAVYDNEGWHPTSYLNQGEFYSEFGNYDVHITADSLYKIACSGELLDSVNSSNPFNAYRTWHYMAKNVNDIAWFADENFKIKRTFFNTATHPVHIYIYTKANADTLWKEADSAVKAALRYYGEWIGEYPYTTCKVVQGNVKQGYPGGGSEMAFPSIILINTDFKSETKDVNEAIFQEVGRNWFGNVLGFNGYRYPWIVDGVCSYYQMRIMRLLYGEQNLNAKQINRKAWTEDQFDYDWLSYRYDIYYNAMASHTDQPANLPSNAYTYNNYQAMIYGKVPLSINYFAKFLTQDTFDARIRKFYHDFAFKHPQPADFKQAFYKGNGKYIDWFFDQLLSNTDHIDYALGACKDTIHIGSSAFQKITVYNRGEVKGPYTISAMKGDSILHSLWYGGFRGKMQVLFPSMPGVKYRIDPNWDIPESNKRNNTTVAGTNHRSLAQLRFALLGKVDDPSRPSLYISPAIAYNTTDGLQLGVVFYNHILCTRPVEYTLVPLYATATGLLNFTGNVTFNIYTHTTRQHIAFGLNTEIFDYAKVYFSNTPITYRRIQPFIDFNIKDHNPLSTIKQKLRADAIILNTGYPYFERHFTNNNFTDYFYNLIYNRKNTTPVNPYTVQVQAQYGHINRYNDYEPPYDYLKLWSEYSQKINYNRPKTYFTYRLFGGTFLYKSDHSYFAPYDFDFHADGGAGYNDYTYSSYFFSRAAQTGFWAHQLLNNDGALKVRADLNPPYGLSNTWMLAANFTSTMPVPSPFKVFFDIATFGKEPLSTYETVAYDAGIMLDLTAVKIYLPFIFSTDLSTNIIQPSFHGLNKLTFSIDLDNLRLLDNAKDVFKL